MPVYTWAKGLGCVYIMFCGPGRQDWCWHQKSQSRDSLMYTTHTALQLRQWCVCVYVHLWCIHVAWLSLLFCCGCRAFSKGSSNAMKAAGLKLAAAVVEGMPQTDRNMAAVQPEAWKLFEKQAKVGHAGSAAWDSLTCLCPTKQWQRHIGHNMANDINQDPSSCVCACDFGAPQDKSSDELRAAAAGLLGSICKAGGAVLWGSTGYYAEEALRAAVAGLDDSAAVSKADNTLCGLS